MKSSLRIYPNPADLNTSIQFEALNPGPMELRLIDETGRIVLERNYSSTNGKNELALNTSKLANGVYILNLQQNRTKISGRLVVRTLGLKVMNNRISYFILSLGLVSVFLLIILALPRHSADTSTGISSLERSEQFLMERLENLDPGTEEAKTIRRNLIKLRLEKESPKLQTENPDAFLTALREVKTGSDGSIYPSNYKLLELEKSKGIQNEEGIKDQNPSMDFTRPR